MKLEAELVKLEGKSPQKGAPEKFPALTKLGMEVGQVGRFGDGFETWHVFVDRVIDENSAILRVLIGGTGSSFRVYAESFPTAGLADDKIITDRVDRWRVTGTKKVGGLTLYTVEPFTGEK